MNQNDLIGYLNTNYGFDVKEIKPLDDKDIHRAFQITNQDEVFVLRLFDSRSHEKLESDIAVLKFLEKQNFPASRIKLTKDGKSLFEFKNQSGLVTSYIDGKHPELNTETVEKIGILMAQLHSLPIDSSIPKSTWTVPEGRRLVQKNIQDLSSQEIEHWDEIIPQLTRAFNELPNLTDLPAVLIHTDIGPNNAIESQDGKLSLIDWDDAGVGQSVVDIGNVLSQILISFKDKELLEPQFNQDLARTFFKGYQSVRQLSDDEKQNITAGMEFAALAYVLLEWIPKIALQNWARYKFAKENNELILSLV